MMEQKLFVVFKLDDVGAMCNVDDFKCFYDIHDYVISKWHQLSNSETKFEYTIADYSRMVLDCDRDLRNMCYLAKKKNIEVVEVTVHTLCSKGTVGECADVQMSVNSGFGFSNGRINCSQQSTSSSYHYVTNNGTQGSYCERQLKLFLTANWGHLIKGVGQYFEVSMDEYRLILAKFCIANGYKYRLKKNAPNNVIAVCASDASTGCAWRIAAVQSKTDGHIHIASFVRIHTCGTVYLSTSDLRCSSELVSSLMIDVVRSTPQITPTGIRCDLKTMYGLDISYKVSKAELAKARTKVFGDEGLSYDSLRFYFQRLKFVDPSCTLNLEYDNDTGHFQRCFVSFGASFHGFQHCRPMIFLDGTHLTSKYSGVLLAATAKDGDMGLFNVAFAVVGREDYDNWYWFLHQLKPLVGGRTINFISDREKGIIKAIEQQFPFDHHSYCYVHLLRNLKNKFPGSKDTRNKIVDAFKGMAHASSKEAYEEAFNKAMSKGGKKMQKFMSYLDPSNFSKFYVEGVRYGEHTSNAAESFNYMIQRYKHLHVTQMIDGIRRHMMEQMCKRRIAAEKWHDVLCPEMMKRYNALVDEGRAWLIYQSSDSEFEVLDKYSAAVDIEARTCSCFTWQHDGFPCAHAIAVFQFLKEKDPFGRIDHHFKAVCYRNIYADNIKPVHGFDPTRIDDELVILPPTTEKRLPGRPKKTRIPSVGEVPKNRMRCSRCGIMGKHNKRTCKAPI